jgi:hypothetical protein
MVFLLKKTFKMKCLYCGRKLPIIPFRLYCNKKCNFDDWRKKNRIHFNNLIKKDYMKNKHKWKARKKTIRIIIPKGQLCEICNKKKAIHKHHNNYSDPFDISFLCFDCHKDIHIVFRNTK